MKIKFVLVVCLIFAVSFSLLSAGFYAVAEKGTESQYYELKEQQFDFKKIQAEENITPPTSQSDLKNEFSSMTNGDKTANSITVISKEYMDEYWRSNYEKEEIKTLSTDEVLYIIQDSINIYSEYDEIILNEFVNVSSNAEVSQRLPSFEKTEIIVPVRGTAEEAFDKMMEDIYRIIYYRVSALSSPKAFVLVADAIIFSGGDPKVFSSRIPEALIYFPNYTKDTNREEILLDIGSIKNITDIGDVVIFQPYSSRVELSIGSTSKLVFPTEEITEKQLIFAHYVTYERYASNYIDKEKFGVWFTLNKDKKTFMMGAASSVSHAIGGTYEKNGDFLTLTFYVRKEYSEEFSVHETGEAESDYSEGIIIGNGETEIDLSGGIILGEGGFYNYTESEKESLYDKFNYVFEKVDGEYIFRLDMSEISEKITYNITNGLAFEKIV